MILRRSRVACRNRARLLGVKFPDSSSHRRWTRKEVDTLRNLADRGEDVFRIAEAVGRTVVACRNALSRMRRGQQKPKPISLEPRRSVVLSNRDERRESVAAGWPPLTANERSVVEYLASCGPASCADLTDGTPVTARHVRRIVDKLLTMEILVRSGRAGGRQLYALRTGRK